MLFPGLRIFLTFAFVQGAIENASHWVTNGGYSYYIFETKIQSNTRARREVCRDKQAELLSIANADEQQFIHSQISTGFWLGLTQPTNKGCDSCADGNENDDCVQCRKTFTWDDGTDNSYQHWLKDHPIDAIRHCARVQGGRWKQASCDAQGSGYVLVCKRTDPCQPVGLCNQGTCEMVFSNQTYNCRCNSGYKGKHCNTDINECDESPCNHGGICTNLEGSYACNCTAQWKGDDCKTDVDECEAQNPCRHGGSCMNSEGGYMCECLEGYTGAQCETEIDECTSEPCQNNAECTDEIDGFTCQCTSYWTGLHCETDLDECEENSNAQYCVQGDCANYQGGFNCTCFDGYTGANCDGTTTGSDKNAGKIESKGSQQGLWIAFYVASTGFSITFIIMTVMAILDRRDVKRQNFRESQDRQRSEIAVSVTDEPSTSGAGAHAM